MTSSGAVSSITRAMASVIPDVMPAIDVRSTTLTITRHFGVPSAYAASRSSLGTILSISSVDRTTTGIISTASATAPMNPSRTAGPAKTATVIARASLPRPYSTSRRDSGWPHLRRSYAEPMDVKPRRGERRLTNGRTRRRCPTA